MEIINLKSHPEYLEEAIAYYQKVWANPSSQAVYDGCLRHAVLTRGLLPQWYLLMDDTKIVGTVGLITNDFISRMDLLPWIAALYVDPDYRNQGWGGKLLEHMKSETMRLGFSNVFLATDLVDYYEQYGFQFIGIGYHPWGEESRIYQLSIKEEEK